MAGIKSPFYIIEEFISRKQCDKIIAELNLTQPNQNKEGEPFKIERFHDALEADLFSRFKHKIPELESYYDCKYVATEKMQFQLLPENPKIPAIAPGCENSKYVRKKWVKVNDVDLTAILWLTDYNDSIPLDTRTDVFGGKLEFPLYNFSLVPQRGTLIVYPSGPHFISVTSPVLVGSLHQVKFNVTIRNKEGGIWLYQPENFQYDKKRGMIESWFSDHLA